MTETLRERRVRLECELLEAKIQSERNSLAGYLSVAERRGEFSLIGDVTEGSVFMIQREIAKYLSENPAAKAIGIYINSGGGHVIDGFALVDYLMYLRSRGIHITATVGGAAMSMASIILQAADERVMGPRAWIGIHEVQSVASGGMSVAQDRLKWAERLQDAALDLYVERCNLSKDDILLMWARKDVMMNAEEALAAGLIDRIA